MLGKKGRRAGSHRLVFGGRSWEQHRWVVRGHWGRREQAPGPSGRPRPNGTTTCAGGGRTTDLPCFLTIPSPLRMRSPAPPRSPLLAGYLRPGGGPAHGRCGSPSTGRRGHAARVPGWGGDQGEAEEWVGRAQGAHFKFYPGPKFKQSSSSSLIIPLIPHSADYFFS